MLTAAKLDGWRFSGEALEVLASWLAEAQFGLQSSTKGSEHGQPCCYPVLDEGCNSRGMGSARDAEQKLPRWMRA